MTTRALTAANVLFSIPDIDGLSVRWPIDGPVYPYDDVRRPAVTQPFAHIRVPDANGNGFRHFGVDLGIVLGTDELAIDEGVVVTARTGAAYGTNPWPDGYGNYVVLRHWWGHSLYAHLEDGSLSPLGWTVPKGVRVGRCGLTGLVTGPHAHVEARLGDNATRFDWQPYVNKPLPQPTEEEQLAMAFSEGELSALHEVAEAQIHGHVMYAGSPGRSHLIRLMDVFRDLSLDPGEAQPQPGILRKAQIRALNSAGAAVKRWAKAP